MSAVVRLIGGPGDGTTVALPTDAAGTPPVEFFAYTANGPVTYDREVNPDDDGPLWQYRYCAPKEAS